MFKYLTMNEIYKGFINGNEHGDSRVLVGLAMLIWDALYGLCVVLSKFKKKEVSHGTCG